MSTSQFGPGSRFSGPVHAAQVAAGRAAAMREDADRQRAALAAGPDRRSIGATRRARDVDVDEM